MVTLLRRIFIPDYQNVNDEKVRVLHGILAAWIGFAINALLVALKLTFAFLLAAKAHWILPMALLADAIDNAGDMASNIVTLIGFRAAMKPADKEHPFGHERIEYIAGLIVSVFVIFAGAELIFNSINAILSGARVSYDWYTVIVLVVSLGLKILQGFMNLKIAKIIDSPSLKATAIDSFTDTLATFAVLLSAILSITCKFDFLDGYFGIAVACFILFSAVKMLFETADPLIGRAYSKKDENRIKALAKAHEEILGVHDILMHRYGPTKVYISLHAEVDGHTPLSLAHDIASRLEEEINDAYHAETTIHIDPVEDEEKEGLKKAQSILDTLNLKASVHDFRLVKKDGKDVIAMDITLEEDSASMKKALLQELEQGFEGYVLEIKFEHPYAL